jgi:hypothetical protein
VVKIAIGRIKINVDEIIPDFFSDIKEKIKLKKTDAKNEGRKAE